MKKFIHMADAHLDMPYTNLKHNRELIKERRTEIRQIFRDVIKLAKTENVDFLFISGDLFEQKYVEDATIEYIISCFKEISDVKIYIAPGNHDPFVKNSPYNTFEWPDNVVIFTGEVGKYIEDDVNIYGMRI